MNRFLLRCSALLLRSLLMTILIAGPGLASAAGGGNGREVKSPNSSADYHGLPGGYVVELFINAPIHNVHAGYYQKNAVPLNYRVRFAVCGNRISYVRVVGRIDLNGGKQTTLTGTNANWMVIHNQVYQAGPTCPAGSFSKNGLSMCFYDRYFNQPMDLRFIKSCQTTLQLVAKLGQEGLAGKGQFPSDIPHATVAPNDAWIAHGWAHGVNIWLNFACPSSSSSSSRSSSSSSLSSSSSSSSSYACSWCSFASSSSSSGTQPHYQWNNNYTSSSSSSSSSSAINPHDWLWNWANQQGWNWGY